MNAASASPPDADSGPDPNDETGGAIAEGDLPVQVPAKFARTVSLTTRGRYSTDKDERVLSAVTTRRRLRRWSAAAASLASRDPEAICGTTVRGAAAGSFVNVIELSRRGRTVATVPNLHGWPLPGPMDPGGRTLAPHEVATVLGALANAPRPGKDARFAKDVAAAGDLLGACLRTRRPDLHEEMSRPDGSCWIVVGLESEGGLTTCVLDGSGSENDPEPVAWHPQASVADAVPARMTCTREQGAWRVVGDERGTDAEAACPFPLDPMETMRLMAPHQAPPDL